MAEIFWSIITFNSGKRKENSRSCVVWNVSRLLPLTNRGRGGGDGWHFRLGRLPKFSVKLLIWVFHDLVMHFIAQVQKPLSLLSKHFVFCHSRCCCRHVCSKVRLNKRIFMQLLSHFTAIFLPQGCNYKPAAILARYRCTFSEKSCEFALSFKHVRNPCDIAANKSCWNSRLVYTCHLKLHIEREKSCV